MPFPVYLFIILKALLVAGDLCMLGAVLIIQSSLQRTRIVLVLLFSSAFFTVHVIIWKAGLVFVFVWLLHAAGLWTFGG